MKKSLSFYQQALGMRVLEDQEISEETIGRLLGIPEARIRITSLQADESAFGTVGLMAFLSPEIKPREAVHKASRGPDVLLLFMADDIGIGATFESVKQGGTEIISAPVAYEVPERGTISGFTCYDPDGVLVALMRFGPLDMKGGRIKASPIRRTSIVVSDLERSLSFYRDTLGLDVFYDQKISSEAEGRMLGIPGATVRVVSLQASGSVEGMVGLISFLSPSLKPRRKTQEAVSTPDVILLFATDEIQALYEKIRQRHWRIQCPPIEYEIPGRGLCTGFSCLDPDGVLVEFAQSNRMAQAGVVNRERQTDG